jgi:hypothetical protein
MGHVDKFDHTVNTYSFNRWMLRWMKKLLFHFLDLWILFWFKVITLTFQTYVCQWPNGWGGKNASTTDTHEEDLPPANWPDLTMTQQWLLEGRQIHVVCDLKNKETRTKFRCPLSSVRLCVTPCFIVYHAKFHFWRLYDITLEQVAHSNTNKSTSASYYIFAVMKYW